MKKIFLRGNPGDFPNYTAALAACGALAVVSMHPEDAEACDGLLIPGGADINPVRYGQENTASEGIDDARDEDEIQLARTFLRWNRPILGICRGHQILNVAFGGDMIQDVKNRDRHIAHAETGDSVHPVTATHPFIETLYGVTFPVNSSHHQAVGRLGDGLMATCISDDGLIEGFIHENGKIIGVQFHPERMAFAHLRTDAVDGEKIFRAFLALL